METKYFYWHSFEEERPAKDSVFLVRGEAKDNDHCSEYYVFLEDGGEYVTAETGKPVGECGNFAGYTFTHWAYIPEPRLMQQ